LKFFKKIQKAKFLSRLNRFTVICKLKGKIVRAFLPNPGRLWELLLPEVTVYLEKDSDKRRTTHYTLVAVKREGIPVMVHTHKTNDIANFLIDKGLVPGLEGTKVIRREVRRGKSRLDFLLKKGKREIILEVKSCTLFSKRVAMFPDAVTLRGKRHIEELASLSNKNREGIVLFLVSCPYAEIFLPEYHTDIDFAKALLSAKKKIKIIPLSIRWKEDLSIDLSDIKVLDVLWRIVEKEAEDRGCYFLILKLPRDTTAEIGRLGKINFRKGYYIYVGSARRNLLKRIERHRRLRKRFFWHIDYLRRVADFYTALPIRTEDDIECEITRDLKRIVDWEVSGFGCSDCLCSSHLFGMSHNPLNLAKFHTLLQFYRMERLIGK